MVVHLRAGTTIVSADAASCDDVFVLSIPRLAKLGVADTLCRIAVDPDSSTCLLSPTPRFGVCFVNNRVVTADCELHHLDTLRLSNDVSFVVVASNSCDAPPLVFSHREPTAEPAAPSSPDDSGAPSGRHLVLINPQSRTEPVLWSLASLAECVIASNGHVRPLAVAHHRARLLCGDTCVLESTRGKRTLRHLSRFTVGTATFVLSDTTDAADVASPTAFDGHTPTDLTLPGLRGLQESLFAMQFQCAMIHDSARCHPDDVERLKQPFGIVATAKPLSKSFGVAHVRPFVDTVVTALASAGQLLASCSCAPPLPAQHDRAWNSALQEAVAAPAPGGDASDVVERCKALAITANVATLDHMVSVLKVVRTDFRPVDRLRSDLKMLLKHIAVPNGHSVERNQKLFLGVLVQFEYCNDNALLREDDVALVVRHRDDMLDFAQRVRRAHRARAAAAAARVESSRRSSDRRGRSSSTSVGARSVSSAGSSRQASLTRAVSPPQRAGSANRPPPRMSTAPPELVTSLRALRSR